MKSPVFRCGVVMLLLTLSGLASAGEPIRIRSVQLTLIDDISVPAREAGILSDVRVKVGSRVNPGEILGRLDQTKAKLAVKQAEIEVGIEKLRAKNDVKVRYAAKSKQVADAELRRAVESEKRFKGSVSASQMDVLQLTAQRAALAVEEANRDLEVAAKTLELKMNKLQHAHNGVARRQIVSSIRGEVADVKRSVGEWVEPGQTVFRVIRLDRLRVKGFVKAADLQGDLKGRGVTVAVTLIGGKTAEFKGKVTHVSSVIDPNTGEIAVWAEVENAQNRLRPGMSGSMQIHSTPAKRSF